MILPLGRLGTGTVQGHDSVDPLNALLLRAFPVVRGALFDAHVAGHPVECGVAGSTPSPLRDGTATVYTSFNRVASIQATNTGIAQMAEGTIKKLTNKGFGFIDIGSGKDLFFHSSSLQGVSFNELREGQKVSYTEGRGPKGPCAENVKPV
jgi:cold shock protein